MSEPGDGLRAALAVLLDGSDLPAEAMQAAMREMMSGTAPEALIGAFLVALKGKGESVDEIQAAAEVMRAMAVPVTADGPLLDLVGTGGDGASLFNVSTAAALVAAAAGVRVVKHGNRAVSSSSGAADLLEAAGARLELSAESVPKLLAAHHFAFLYAPAFHPAVRHVAPVRRALRLRTLFNLLGPLCNPARPGHALIGVYDRRFARPMAEALGRLGATHVLVVHADDGLDELSIAAPAFVAEWRDGEVHTFELDPDHLGVRMQPLEALRVADVGASLALVRAVLAGHDRGPATEMVALNAGAALYAADQVATMKFGVQRAREVLRDGAAERLLDAYATTSRSSGV